MQGRFGGDSFQAFEGVWERWAGDAVHAGVEFFAVYGSGDDATDLDRSGKVLAPTVSRGGDGEADDRVRHP